MIQDGADYATMTLDKIGDLLSKAVDLWMDTVQTLPAIHWANIGLGGYLMGSNAVTGIHRFSGGAGTARNTMVQYLTLGLADFLPSLYSNSGVAREVANAMNAIADELKDPNIEGIPIHAIKETDSRDIDISTNVVIRATSANKDYQIDNAVPQLKQWQINGYLTSFQDGLDPFLVIKPGLLVQKALLDAYAKSRRPVWFKTHDNHFEKVLIKHIDSAYDPQYLNGLAVNITLVEFKTMETEETTLAAAKGLLKK
jgi:hypothetical protein